MKHRERKAVSQGARIHELQDRVDDLTGTVALQIGLIQDLQEWVEAQGPRLKELGIEPPQIGRTTRRLIREAAIEPLEEALAHLKDDCDLSADVRQQLGETIGEIRTALLAEEPFERLHALLGSAFGRAEEADCGSTLDALDAAHHVLFPSDHEHGEDEEHEEEG